MNAPERGKPTVMDLGTLPDGELLDFTDYYRNGNDVRVLCRMKTGEGVSLYSNGRALATGFRRIESSRFLSGGRVIFSGRKKGEDVIVLNDGKSEKIIAQGELTGPYVYPDLERWCWFRHGPLSPLKKDDGNRVPFSVFVLPDGTESEPLVLDDWVQPVFSGDGRHVAFHAYFVQENEGAPVVVVDGKIVARYTPGCVIRKMFFASSGRLCYAVTSETESFVVAGETRRKLPEERIHDGLTRTMEPKFRSLAFSDDGEREALPVVEGKLGASIMGFIQLTATEKRGRLLENGKEVKGNFDAVGSPVYAPGTHLLAFVGREEARVGKETEERERVVLDGKPEQHHFRYVRGLRFVPEFATMAYIGGEAGSERLVLGNMKLPEHKRELVGEIAFSAEAGMVAYVARWSDHNGSPFHSGLPGETGSPSTNRKGQLFVQNVSSGEKGAELEGTTAGPVEDAIVFPEFLNDGDFISYVALRGRKLVWYVALPEAPQDYDFHRIAGRYWGNHYAWKFDTASQPGVAWPVYRQDGYEFAELRKDGTFAFQVFPEQGMTPRLSIGGNYRVSGYCDIIFKPNGKFVVRGAGDVPDTTRYEYEPGISPAEAEELYGMWRFDQARDLISLKEEYPYPHTERPNGVSVMSVPVPRYWKREKADQR